MRQILCFGDSNTYGLVPGMKQRYSWGIRWTSIVEEEVRKWGCHVIEEGLCGRTTMFEDVYRKGRNGTEMLPILLETHAPIDTVVLMLGTNDCKTAYGASPQRIGEGIEKLLDQIETWNAGANVLLVSPIALAEGVGEEGYDPEFDENAVVVSKALPEVYAEIADRRGIDFLAASDYACADGADREHLGVAGHRHLATAVIRKLEDMYFNKNTREVPVSFYSVAVS